MAEDYAARSVDEFGFLRTSNGARILCNPSSNYYNPPERQLPHRKWIVHNQLREDVKSRRNTSLDRSVEDI